MLKTPTEIENRSGTGLEGKIISPVWYLCVDTEQKAGYSHLRL